jgi:hypothetical protein
MCRATNECGICRVYELRCVAPVFIQVVIFKSNLNSYILCSMACSLPYFVRTTLVLVISLEYMRVQGSHSPLLLG